MNEVPSGITVTGVQQRQAWLDRVLPPVELVQPGLWSIPTVFPNNPLRYVLTYAVAYDRGIALVDTGWPCQDAWDGLQAGLREAGWSMGDIKAVLITHGHGDHMGLASRIREQSGAWVAMHEADVQEASYTQVKDIARASEAWLVKRGGLPADFESIRSAKIDMFDEFGLVPDRYLVDGERPLGAGTDLISVWTPGHTPGHTCFFDSGRNMLLTGDHILPRITPNISPGPFDASDILGQYLQSVRSLAGMAADEVLPAHEYRFHGLDARVNGLLAHHENRLGEVMQVLQGRRGATTVQVSEGLHWSRPWDQMQGMQRRFAIGEAYSHLVHLDQTGFVTNKGTDVDDWHALRATGPQLV